MDNTKKKWSSKEIFSFIKQAIHFITMVFMYVIFLILILIGIVFAMYFFDQKKNLDSGKNLPPLFNAYVIISPSMVPTIKVQDAVIIKRVEENQLKKGDMITFNSTDYRYSGVTVTHRIVGIEKIEDGRILYTTKGDNNNTPDTTRITYDNIYGKVIMRIPKIGYLQYFLTQSYGWIIAVVIPCLGIIIYDIIKLIKSLHTAVVPSRKRKNMKKKRKEKIVSSDKYKDKRVRFR